MLKILISLLMVLVSVLCVGCVTAPSLIVTDPDNGKSITLKKGDVIEIRLEAQLSTGYGWKIQSLKGLSQKGETVVITEMKNKTGGKDIQKMTFTANERGIGVIEMTYIQSWQEKKAPEKTFLLNVNIE
jgi:predicted secreted protein